MAASAVRCEEFLDVEDSFGASGDDVGFLSAVVDDSDRYVRVAIFLEPVDEDRESADIVLSFRPCEVDFCAVNVYFLCVFSESVE